VLRKERSPQLYDSLHSERPGRKLGTAEEWGYVAENPALKTKLPRREGKTERRTLSPEEIRLLVSNLQEPARSLVLLLTATGLRNRGAACITLEEPGSQGRDASGDGDGV
jgi:hypothetical protein